jgi:hypothetical protein
MTWHPQGGGAAVPRIPLLTIVFVEAMHEFQTYRLAKHGGERFIRGVLQYGLELFI